MRKPGVAHQDVDDVLLQDPLPGNPDRRQNEGFLKRFGGRRIVVSGHRAADVMPMADGCEVAEQLAISEIGPHQPHVAQMRSAHVGVIEDIDVAVGQVAVSRGLFDDGLHREAHDADEDWQAGLALHKGVAGFRMIETMTGVMCFGDDRIECGAKQGRVHLVRYLFHAPG